MFEKTKSTELYATLAQACKDVTAIREWLYLSKDRIDEHILENLKSFDEKVKKALQDYENLSDEKQSILKELYKKVVYPFDYVGVDEPKKPNVNETWFKSDEVRIFKFIQNPKITFFQKERPQERNINDIWFKPTDTDDLQAGEFYLCEEVLESKSWINPSLPKNLKPTYESEEEPEEAKLGDIWKKTSTDEYFVYVKTTSGNSWTSPENPSQYEPTYESEEEPEDAKLGDIWKKGDEYLIYVRVTNDTAWILKEGLNISAYIWFNDEKESIDFILSLIGDLKKEDKDEETSKNEIKDLEQSIKDKNEELQNIKEQIKEALLQDPPQNTDKLNQRKEELEKEIAQVQEELNTKKEKLEQIQKDKSLISQKVLNEALSLKVSKSGNESIDGVKTFNNDLFVKGDANFSKMPTCSILPDNDHKLANKSYVDYGGGIKNLGTIGSVNLDLRQAQHFILTANAGTKIGISNWGGAGKSGTITINNCQNVTGFNAPFKFRTAQSGFSGTETFAYFCIASNNVRIVRT
ncbi:hypothetical protein KY417_001159 [Campylobacter jejuni]|nr:hypothetical protein [Campylobacter jejuni]EFP2059050.1 hypothetical protein [Campylobacter jejuni]EHU3473164.1 hypothetical protein [Campylobacter jejuni]